jgi:c-di-GMP-binding flagellar brake protein YcgR
MTMQSAHLSIEKRRHPRVDMKVPVRFKVINRGAERERILAEARDQGSTTNLSTGGVALRTTEALKMSDLIKLEIELSGRDRVIRTFAEVMWVVQDKDGKGREAGLQFLAVKTADEDLLSVFVMNLLKGQ